jgi:hypothetical protein
MEAIFCTECGAQNPLSAESASPDTANPAAGRTCVACGKPLDLEQDQAKAHDATEPAPAPPEVAPGLREEEAADPLIAAAIAAYSGAARTPPSLIPDAAATAAPPAALAAAPSIEAEPAAAAIAPASPTPTPIAPAIPIPIPEAAPAPAAEAAPETPAAPAPAPAPAPTAIPTAAVPAFAPARDPEPQRTLIATEAPVVTSTVEDPPVVFHPPLRRGVAWIGGATLALVGAFFLGRTTAADREAVSDCPPKELSTAAHANAPNDIPPPPPIESATTPAKEAPMAAARAGAAWPGSALPSKAPFNAKAAVRALKLASARAASCKRAGDPHGSAVVMVTFANTGHAASADVTGAPFSGTPTANCLSALLRNARVPAFAGEPVTVKKTIAL